MSNSFEIRDTCISGKINLGQQRKSKSTVKYYDINLDDARLTMKLLECRLPFDVDEQHGKINLQLAEQQSLVLKDFETKIIAEIAQNPELMTMLKIKNSMTEIVQAKFLSSIKQKEPYPSNLVVKIRGSHIFNASSEPLLVLDLSKTLPRGSTVSVLLQPKVWSNGSNCGIGFDCFQLKILENSPPPPVIKECLI